MRAVVKKRREKGAVEIENVPKPQPGPKDLLIQVKAAALCGSDIHSYLYSPAFHYIRPPLTLGHEFSGKVVEKGKEVEGFDMGDKVIGESLHYCGHCYQCRIGATNLCQNFKVLGLHFDGALAEYVKLEARFVHKIPTRLEWECAALVEPISIAVHAVSNSKISPEDLVLVTGTGPIGILVGQIARISGSSEVVITGTNEDEKIRLAVAEKLGFRAVNVEKENLQEIILDLSKGRGADVVFECSGSVPAFLQGIDLLKKGGQLVATGIQSANAEMSMVHFVRNGLKLSSNFGSLWKHYEDSITLIDRGRINTKALIAPYELNEAISAIHASTNKEVSKAVMVL